MYLLLCTHQFYTEIYLSLITRRTLTILRNLIIFSILKSRGVFDKLERLLDVSWIIASITVEYGNVETMSIKNQPVK